MYIVHNMTYRMIIKIRKTEWINISNIFYCIYVRPQIIMHYYLFSLTYWNTEWLKIITYQKQVIFFNSRLWYLYFYRLNYLLNHVHNRIIIKLVVPIHFILGKTICLYILFSSKNKITYCIANIIRYLLLV